MMHQNCLVVLVLDLRVLIHRLQQDESRNFIIACPFFLEGVSKTYIIDGTIVFQPHLSEHFFHDGRCGFGHILLWLTFTGMYEPQQFQ